MALDRLKLHNALHSHDDGQDKIHLWGQEVDTLFKPDSITLKDFRTFDIPFRADEDLTSIISQFKESNLTDQARQYTNSCCKVPANNILLPHTNSVQKSLGQSIDLAFRKEFAPVLENFRINMDIHMRSMAICQTPESVLKFPQEKGHPGAFGLMLLQLPVGSDSSVNAYISTEYSMRKENLNYQLKHSYHLTFVAGRGNDVFDTKITVHSSEKNPIVFLVYDLVWLDSLRLLRNPSAKVVLNFLGNLKKANEALSGWEYVEVDRLNLKYRDNRRYPPSLSRTFNFTLVDAQKTALLCISTKHNYNSYELQMERLMDEDVRTLNLLKTIHFIDASLGVLRISYDPSKESDDDSDEDDEDEKRVPSIDWEKEATSSERKIFSVDRWTQGDWTFPDAHDNFHMLRLDWHLVGDVKSKLDDSDYNRMSLMPWRRQSYHPAIIIRPRKAAIIDCWKDSPFRTVECLTQRTKLALDCDYSRAGLGRQRLIQDLNFIHSLIVDVTEDRLYECGKTALLHQLLYLCTRLEAVDEGLKIMEDIPRTQCECRGAHHPGDLKGFIGVRKDFDLLELVTDMVSLAGWERCSSHVYGMYSRREIQDTRQLFRLSSALKRLGCIDGAITFAKACLRIHVENDYDMDEAPEDELDWDDIEYFLKLIFKKNSASNNDDDREILALLKEIAIEDCMVIKVMIQYYLDYLDNEEKSASLKFTIADAIAQRQCFDFDSTAMFKVITFLYLTRNAELAEFVWSKCIDSENGEQEGCFEELLSDCACFEMNPGDHEALYEAIALSPLAKERLYRFIDKQKTKTESLVRCFFHLTMAQREPSLADREKLQSFISVFKEMSLTSLLKAAEDTVHHNRSGLYGLPISQTITAALLDCLLTNDLASLLYQETNEFSKIVYYFIQLGDNFTKLRLLEIIKETLLNGNYEESNPADGDATTRLINIWLTCLKMKFDVGDSKRSIVMYQTLNFFPFYFKSKRIFFDSQPEVRHFISLSSHLTLQYLEKFLIALYEREQHQRVSKCLKEDSSQWRISQGLSNLFAVHPEMKKAILDFEAERIVKLTCCIFWLGSQPAIREFVDLVCELSCSTTKRCLNVLIYSGDQVKNCAISSPFAFAALQKLICCCMEHSFSGPGYSWARQVEVGCSEVDEFYQSEEKSNLFGPFETHKDASNFGAFATKHRLWAAYVVNTSENTCEITKLFSAVVDDVLWSSVPHSHEILREPCNEFLPKNCPIDCVSKTKKCTVCLTPALTALHDAM